MECKYKAKVQGCRVFDYVQYHVKIPIMIARMLQLQKGSIVEVTIKKVDV